MIVVDVETGGLDPIRNSLLSIGAVEYEDPTNEFYVELEPLAGTEIHPKVLSINDYSPNTWKNTNHFVGMNLFYEWIKQIPDKTLAGHNPAFDRDFCNANFEHAKLGRVFDFHTVDLHTLAYQKFGKSLSANRIYDKLQMRREPDPHNALNGAKWECEAIRELMR